MHINILHLHNTDHEHHNMKMDRHYQNTSYTNPICKNADDYMQSVYEVSLSSPYL